jgi:ring-1,2-phenylacetyl-CoA epoxidase subunit PaaA
MAWGIKRFSNNELRQKFVDMTVPQSHVLGLSIPDPDLRWNEARGHYDFTSPDWDELRRVISGDGPCNRQRIAYRVRAHTEGGWVRDAGHAYAAKHSPAEERGAA